MINIVVRFCTSSFAFIELSNHTKVPVTEQSTPGIHRGSAVDEMSALYTTQPDVPFPFLHIIPHTIPSTEHLPTWIFNICSPDSFSESFPKSETVVAWFLSSALYAPKQLR